VTGTGSLVTFPTNVSAFTNDAGYITAGSSSNLTNKTGNISQWTNDAGYLTAVVGFLPLAAGSGSPLTGDLYLSGNRTIFWSNNTANNISAASTGNLAVAAGSTLFLTTGAVTALTISSAQKLIATSTVTATKFIANSAADNGIDTIQSGGGSILGNLIRLEGKIQGSSVTIDATATHWNDNTNGSTVTYTLPVGGNLSAGVFLFSKTGTGTLTLSGAIITIAGASVGSAAITSVSGMKLYYNNGINWYQLN
jgi:hypothetical protein